MRAGGPGRAFVGTCGARAGGKILTQREPLTYVIAAYKAFDLRQPGWIKVELEPSA